MVKCLVGTMRIPCLGRFQRNKSFYSSLVPCNGRGFPSSLVWNPWVPKRVIFFFLGGYLGKNSNYGSTKQEGLDFTKKVFFV